MSMDFMTTEKSNKLMDKVRMCIFKGQDYSSLIEECGAMQLLEAFLSTYGSCESSSMNRRALIDLQALSAL